MRLDDRELRTLDAVCDALLPRLDLPDERRAHFRLGARDLGVPVAMQDAIALLNRRRAFELRLFLRLLSTPPFMLVAAGRWSAFADLDATSRERALLSLSRHPLPPIRSGFQALKRLASFLFYAVTPEGGENPVHADLGYARPPRRDAIRRFRVGLERVPDILTADVCVVGSGAGGSVVAAALAATGRRVLILEAGPGDLAPDFDHRELVGTQRLYLDHGTTATRDLGLAVLAGRCVGGGTTVNWQTSLRLPDFIREEWAERSGIADFAGDRFTAALDAVCARLSVGTAESQHNANNAALARGCDALGYRWSTIPRNARGCDPEQCCFCAFGCRAGGKQSTPETYLADAMRTGNATILPRCRVLGARIKRGRVVGVDAALSDETGHSQRLLRVDAPVVVIAAGAIETPALLMRSGVEHAELGKHLFLHPTTAVGGIYDQPVRGWVGAPQSVLCDEFARVDGTYGFRLETPPVHPGLFSIAVQWTGARAFREEMQEISRSAAFIVLTRDATGGRVRVDRDGNAVMDYAPGTLERRLLQQGIGEAARLHWAAGAREVSTLHAEPLRLRRDDPDASIDALVAQSQRRAVHANRSQLFSAHQMGTCRMGADPTGSVCDEMGRVRGAHGLYVADASLFPASSGVNPMITVMALAHMVGETLATP